MNTLYIHDIMSERESSEKHLTNGEVDHEYVLSS